MKKHLSRLLAVALAVALVVTCAISGLILPVSAEETTADPNLLADFVLSKSEFGAGERTSSITVNTPLEAGRYALRFETKGSIGFVSMYVGAWNQTNTKAIEAWRMYQKIITLTEDIESFDLQFGSRSDVEGEIFSVRNVQLYKITDGFNLAYGADMSIESMLWDARDEYVGDAYLNKEASITTDPTDPSNSVMKLARDKSYYVTTTKQISFGGGYSLPEGKALMVTVRRTGSGLLLRRAWNNNGYPCYSYPLCHKATALNEWVTDKWFVTAEDLADTNGTFLGFNSDKAAGLTLQGPYEEAEVYIDDLVIQEVDASAVSFSFDNTVTAKAGEHGLTVQTEGNAYPGKLTWSISNNTTTDTGSETKTITINANTGVVTIPEGSYSLDSVKPIVTVTGTYADGSTVTCTKTLEWEYLTFPFVNGDFEDGAAGWGGNNTTGGSSDSVGSLWAPRFVTSGGVDNSACLYIPDYAEDTTLAATAHLYANQTIFLKPNSVYRVTCELKTTNSNISFGCYEAPVNATFKAPSVNPMTTEGDEWYLLVAHIYTEDEPILRKNSLNVGRESSSLTGEIYVDNYKLELVEEGESEIIGDFEQPSTFQDFINRANTKFSIYDGTSSPIAGNSTKMLKLAEGTDPDRAAGNMVRTDGAWTIPLRSNRAYEITFKACGSPDAAIYFRGNGGYSLFHTVQNGNTKLSRNDPEKWETYTFRFVYATPANWATSYAIYFGSGKNAATPLYIDDFTFREINSAYVSNATLDTNLANGTITMETASGATISSSLAQEVREKEEITVTVTPKDGYLPIPGTLAYVDLDGHNTPILNTALTGMTGSAGNQFKFKMPDKTVRVTCQFAPVSEQGYQWGTIATGVRHVKVDGEEMYDGIRSLNRIYIDGLNWNADTLTTTIAGQSYTITEIGAVARKADTGDLDKDNYERKGLCYSIDDPDGTIKVQDYTQQYFDFTVVIKYNTPVKSDATVYQWRAYMILESADGSDTQVIYTDINTDSLDAALSRGA